MIKRTTTAVNDFIAFIIVNCKSRKHVQINYVKEELNG